jgi:hypothetical protein
MDATFFSQLEAHAKVIFDYSSVFLRVLTQSSASYSKTDLISLC